MRAMHRAKVGELEQMRHELRQLEELKAVEAEEMTRQITDGYAYGEMWTRGLCQRVEI